MNFVSWILLAAVGELSIFTLRKFPLVANIKNATLRQLIDCNFCLGVWIYWGLFLLFREDIFKDTFRYIPILNELLSGTLTSFLVWIFIDGWKARFEVIKL